MILVGTGVLGGLYCFRGGGIEVSVILILKFIRGIFGNGWGGKFCVFFIIIKIFLKLFKKYNEILLF